MTAKRGARRATRASSTAAHPAADPPTPLQSTPRRASTDDAAPGDAPASTATAAAPAVTRSDTQSVARPGAIGRLLLAGIRLYQAGISPGLGARCRFEPTCSRYAHEAIERHGALRGSWLAARRLLRCHPGTPPGYDPVPPPRQPSA